MSERIIFLDMDGVLCDWVKGVCDVLGKDYHKMMSLWTPGSQSLSDVLGVKKSSYWNPIDKQGPKFWRGLPELPWFQELWDLASQHGKVMVLTSPSCHGSSAQGKMKWLADRFGRFQFRDFIITNRKWICAGPNRVLVDDNNRQCVDFRNPPDGSPGGQTLLFPRVWNENHEHHHDPMGYARKWFAEL